MRPPRPLLPATSRARRGSLIVTTFVIVLGLTFVLGGVNTLLKEQMRQSLEIKSLTMGRLQMLYLAEMGVNQFMYDVNRTNVLALPLMPYDFTLTVAMTRDEVQRTADPTAAEAECAITLDAQNRFVATPTLRVGSETYAIPWTIRFMVSREPNNGHFVLSRYEVIER